MSFPGEDRKWSADGQNAIDPKQTKHVGELCHAEALFHRQASEQSLTSLRVCRHVSLDGKRCVRLNQRSVISDIHKLTGAADDDMAAILT
jgi:hypothetical protein